MVFRSGHPRALHPLIPRRRRATMTPHRRVVHSYYPPHFRRPIFILGFGTLLLLSSSSTLPSVRLPLSYSYNPTHSIPPCYYLLDLVPLPNLSCVSSPHTQHVNASMFSPPSFVLCFYASSIGLPCFAFFSPFFLLFNDCDGDDEYVLLLLFLRHPFLFSASLFYVILLDSFYPLLVLTQAPFSFFSFSLLWRLLVP